MIKRARERESVLFSLKGISKIFRMGEIDILALRDVSLEIMAGEVVVILGPSGSGKTTLLNILGGVDRATAGEVWFGGRNLTTATERQLRRYRRLSVGFVFQFYNLIPDLTASENVSMATDLCPAPMDGVEALGLVGLEHRVHHFPSKLSGGEQQRVAIARALAKHPDVLLCDELTGALDAATGVDVLRCVLQLNRQLAQTVVIVTHNSAIGKLANRVVTMRSGQIVELRENAEPLPPESIRW